MGLDVTLYGEPDTETCRCQCGHWHTREVRPKLWEGYLLSTLAMMEYVDHVGLWEVIYNPTGLGLTRAHQFIGSLREGLARLDAAPIGLEMKKPDPPESKVNSRLLLRQFIAEFLEACEANSEAYVEFDR